MSFINARIHMLIHHTAHTHTAVLKVTDIFWHRQFYTICRCALSMIFVSARREKEATTSFRVDIEYMEIMRCHSVNGGKNYCYCTKQTFHIEKQVFAPIDRNWRTHKHSLKFLTRCACHFEMDTNVRIVFTCGIHMCLYACMCLNYNNQCGQLANPNIKLDLMLLCAMIRA